MERVPTSSVSIADKPRWAVVTDSPAWGYGVFSWHVVEQDAKYNASVTGGRLLPVDYVGGEIIIPPLARAIVRRKVGKDGERDIFG